MIYSGSSDANVRVWNSKECIPQITMNASDDPELNFLENKISKATTLGVGSRSNLKFLMDYICEVLAVKPIWRLGVISSFFDGKVYSTISHSQAQTLGVEVMFEDKSVQMFSNRLLIRNRDEVALVPLGPPMWHRQEAAMVVGTKVAVFDIDPAAVGQVCCRFLGITASRKLSYDDCKTVIEQLIPSAAREDFDVKGTMLGLKLDVGCHMDVKTLIKRICLCRERFVSSCDRLLSGHTVAIASIRFFTSSNLLVSTDTDGVVCVWDPFSKKAIVGSSEFEYAGWV